MTPLSLLNLNIGFATLLWEAQTVMTLRLLGFAGAIPSHPGEVNRMITEKPVAYTEAWFRAAEAVVAGKSADAIMEAATKPLHRKVRANKQRLMR